MSGVTIHYMRDNHMFRPLPLDVEAALKILRDERDAGQTYGMLCSKQIKNVVHASSAAEWDDFELRAREWLEVAIKFEVPPTPEDELTRLRAECDALRDALRLVEPHLPFDWAFDSIRGLVGQNDYREACAKARAALKEAK